jgi:ferredoxin
MCSKCGKHVTERLWYLEPEKHRLQSMGLLHEVFNRNLPPIVNAGLWVVSHKQPYGQRLQLAGPGRHLFNWLTRTVHGVQTLPDQESAFRVIDLANELALMPCPCRQMMAPHLPPAWKCLGLNLAAKVYFRHENREPVKAINKEAAKAVVAEWRARGAYQSVGWLWNANVVWVCNCDEHCASHRLHEVEWATVPSFVVASLAQPEACSGCRACARWCLRPGALTFGPDDRVVVDPSLCRGCGLCIEHCPRQALAFAPRQVFYDVLHKTVRPLGN